MHVGRGLLLGTFFLLSIFYHSTEQEIAAAVDMFSRRRDGDGDRDKGGDETQAAAAGAAGAAAGAAGGAGAPKDLKSTQKPQKRLAQMEEEREKERMQNNSGKSAPIFGGTNTSINSTIGADSHSRAGGASYLFQQKFRKAKKE